MDLSFAVYSYIYNYFNFEYVEKELIIMDERNEVK